MISGLSGTVAPATLSVDQMPSHAHDTKERQIFMEGNQRNAARIDGDPISGVCLTTGGSQSHTHSMTNVSSGSVNSIPPYYVLSYIMRTM